MWDTGEERSTSCRVVEGAGVVVVGSGVVMMQEGGVQVDREKSPVFPNTLDWCYEHNVTWFTLVMKVKSTLQGTSVLFSSNSMCSDGKGLDRGLKQGNL